MLVLFQYALDILVIAEIDEMLITFIFMACMRECSIV